MVVAPKMTPNCNCKYGSSSGNELVDNTCFDGVWPGAGIQSQDSLNVQGQAETRVLSIHFGLVNACVCDKNNNRNNNTI